MLDGKLAPMIPVSGHREACVSIARPGSQIAPKGARQDLTSHAIPGMNGAHAMRFPGSVGPCSISIALLSAAAHTPRNGT
jgi:hypothetical protein